MYSLFYYIGFFIFLLIGAGLAVAFAKSKASWVLLGIGAVIQLLGLLGAVDSMAWAIYVLILVGAVAWILHRQKQPPKQDFQGYQANGNYQPVDIAPGAPVPEGHWRCQCGRCNPNYAMSCVCGATRQR